MRSICWTAADADARHEHVSFHTIYVKQTRLQKYPSTFEDNEDDTGRDDVAIVRYQRRSPVDENVWS